jgi:hypothetical protein
MENPRPVLIQTTGGRKAQPKRTIRSRRSSTGVSNDGGPHAIRDLSLRDGDGRTLNPTADAIQYMSLTKNLASPHTHVLRILAHNAKFAMLCAVWLVYSGYCVISIR